MLDVWRLTDVGSETSIHMQPVADPVAWLQDAEQRHGLAVSAVGHVDSAALYSAMLGRDVEFNRITVKAGEADELLIGQLMGPRPPEGSTTLPPGARIAWIAVMVSSQHQDL